MKRNGIRKVKLSNINLIWNIFRIKLNIFISRTNVLILTQAMFAKESKKAKTIFKEKTKKSN